ncbi:maleylacetoacetate isomerase [Sphingomonas metalli]|uniref:Maleylacetoacetate isomerase n=1 Tax=Sphingomonas metalli TaxID=1779358 RepID=A0A916WQU6_9SPHN|nr:maleylacetoacetate isomerase [Sphingomonas metalli]GGB23953.1 maleylacetoacetate isomerase [Sphingomonas metalli]
MGDPLTPPPILHGYFRSTASWRVRIALHLKGIAHRDAFHHLRHGGQRTPGYLAINPQGLVPALETAQGVLTQSLAICDYLDAIVPEPPLLPADPFAAARVRGFAMAIACDVHPVQNLSVLARLRALGLGEEAVTGWARDVIEGGLTACAALIADQPGPYCFGAAVTLADLCLVPQMANARRFGAPTGIGRLEAIEAACLALPAFDATRPERQADAE